MGTTKNSEQTSGIRPGVIVVIVAVIGVLIAGKFLGWYGGKSAADGVGTPASDGSAAASGTASKPENPSGTRPSALRACLTQ